MAFQSDAFQNLTAHGDAGFQVDGGGAPVNSIAYRMIQGNEEDGSDDWVQQWEI
jgi:hypothetical protein